MWWYPAGFRYRSSWVPVRTSINTPEGNIDDCSCPAVTQRQVSPSHTKKPIAAEELESGPVLENNEDKNKVPCHPHKRKLWRLWDLVHVLLSSLVSVFTSSKIDTSLSIVSFFIKFFFPSHPVHLLILLQMRVKVDHRSGSDSRARTRLRSRHCFLWAGQSLCWH